MKRETVLKSQLKQKTEASKSEIKRLSESIIYGADNKTRRYQNMITADTTHIGKHHTHNEAEQMDLMFENPGKTHSEFSSQETADNCVSRTIMVNAEKIAKWVLTTPEYDINTNGKSRLELHASMKDLNPENGSIGSGFRENSDGKIRQYDTLYTTVVIERDNSDAHKPYGFTALTAYPNIETKGIPTNKDCSPILHQTNTYRDASRIKKAYLDKMANPDCTDQVQYNEKTDTMQLALPDYKNKTATIYISQREVRLKTDKKTVSNTLCKDKELQKRKLEEFNAEIKKLPEESQETFRNTIKSINHVGKTRQPVSQVKVQPQDTATKLMQKAEEQKNRQAGTRQAPPKPMENKPMKPRITKESQNTATESKRGEEAEEKLHTKDIIANAPDPNAKDKPDGPNGT